MGKNMDPIWKSKKIF